MKKKDYIIIIIIIIIMAILVLCNCIAIPCIFHKITGLYCPGCGITRAIKAVLKGDFYSSVKNNLLLYIVFLPICVIQVLSFILSKKYKNTDKFSKKYKKVSNIIVIILLIITISYGILRNIPGFSFLTPEQGENNALINVCIIKFK